MEPPKQPPGGGKLQSIPQENKIRKKGFTLNFPTKRWKRRIISCEGKFEDKIKKTKEKKNCDMPVSCVPIVPWLHSCVSAETHSAVRNYELHSVNGKCQQETSSPWNKHRALEAHKLLLWKNRKTADVPFVWNIKQNGLSLNSQLNRPLKQPLPLPHTLASVHPKWSLLSWCPFFPNTTFFPDMTGVYGAEWKLARQGRERALLGFSWIVASH